MVDPGAMRVEHAAFERGSRAHAGGVDLHRCRGRAIPSIGSNLPEHLIPIPYRALHDAQAAGHFVHHTAQASWANQSTPDPAAHGIVPILLSFEIGRGR